MQRKWCASGLLHPVLEKLFLFVFPIPSFREFVGRLISKCGKGTRSTASILITRESNSIHRRFRREASLAGVKKKGMVMHIYWIYSSQHHMQRNSGNKKFVRTPYDTHPRRASHGTAFSSPGKALLKSGAFDHTDLQMTANVVTSFSTRPPAASWAGAGSPGR
jgi:hypothetical protein